MSTAWIIAIMLFVWLSASGQRADMGFFNCIRLYTDINVMCKASNDSIGWISYDGIDRGNDAIVAVLNKDVMTIYQKESAKELPDTVYVFYSELRSVENSYEATLAIDSLITEKNSRPYYKGMER